MALLFKACQLCPENRPYYPKPNRSLSAPKRRHSTAPKTAAKFPPEAGPQPSSTPAAGFGVANGTLGVTPRNFILRIQYLEIPRAANFPAFHSMLSSDT
jgi:hypothetical protein